MGSELNKLKALYGVSTPTIAAYTGATNPGAAPAAVTAVIKPADLRASPVAPVKPTNPGNRATPEEKAAYQAALATYNTNKSAYDTDLNKWKTEKSAYDTSLKTYTDALPKYNADVAAYEKAKAAFEEQKAKYDVDRTAYDQYTGEYKNRMANTNMYNQNQFSTTGANVPPFMSFGDQPMPPPVDQFMPPPPPVNQMRTSGLGQSVGQSVMPPPPPPNTMNTGTQYGQPQWADTLTAPQYSGSDSYIPPVADVGTVPNVNTGSTGNTGGMTEFVQTAIDLKNNPSDQGLKDLFMSYLPGVLGLPQGFKNQNNSKSNGRDKDNTGNAGVSSAPPSGGYISFGDRFDGGGPGVKGGPFQGGGVLSKIANKIFGRAEGGQVRNYAHGGQVRGFANGGTEGVPIEEIATSAIDSAETPEAGMAGVQTLLDKYYPAGGDYAGDVKSARDKADAESVAFMDLMKGYMQNPESARSSKAEMYFRLAAAFGSPTKTGAFGENLALANTELADYAKGQRATAAEQLQLQMEMQKMKMQGAKEDLVAARDLATTDMSNRRAIASDLIKEYIASGKPQSDAEKYAVALGFVRGTPEYDAKVKELAQIDIDKATAEIAAAQTRASDPASTFGKIAVDMGYPRGTPEHEVEVKRQVDQEAARVDALNAATMAGTAVKEKDLGQISPQLIPILKETEDKIASIDSATGALTEAYRLNANSFDGGFEEGAQKFIFGNLNPTDERVIATNLMNNLLKEQVLSSLKATFGASPTDAEGAMLNEIQGIGAKSRKERGEIIKRAARVLAARRAAESQRLEDIKSGQYTTITPEETP